MSGAALAETLTRVFVRSSTLERDRIQFVSLGGLRVGLRTRYAAVDARWRLWLLDLDGTQIFGPATMLPGLDLLVGAKHDPRVPQGELFVYSADRSPPDSETMDATAVLYYRDTR